MQCVVGGSRSNSGNLSGELLFVLVSLDCEHRLPGYVGLDRRVVFFGKGCGPALCIGVHEVNAVLAVIRINVYLVFFIDGRSRWRLGRGKWVGDKVCIIERVWFPGGRWAGAELVRSGALSDMCWKGWRGH